MTTCTEPGWDHGQDFARRIPLDLSAPCVLWQGPQVNSSGYAQVWIDGERKSVHRLAYQLHVGPIRPRNHVDHACHSAAVEKGDCDGGVACPHRLCWNPAHLETVSPRDNSYRSANPNYVNSRNNKCARGHDMTNPANVYLRAGNGRRTCRLCTADGRARREAKAFQDARPAEEPSPIADQGVAVALGALRIQRSRKRGWTMPRGAIYVGRPSKWGNPFHLGGLDVDGVSPMTRTRAVERYLAWLKDGGLDVEAQQELRGKTLVCWCPVGMRCHADVLLAIANAESAP